MKTGTWRRTQNGDIVPKEEPRKGLQTQLGAPHMDIPRQLSKAGTFASSGMTVGWGQLQRASHQPLVPHILLPLSQAYPLHHQEVSLAQRDLSKLEILQVLFFIIFSTQPFVCQTMYRELRA